MTDATKTKLRKIAKGFALALLGAAAGYASLVTPNLAAMVGPMGAGLVTVAVSTAANAILQYVKDEQAEDAEPAQFATLKAVASPISLDSPVDLLRSGIISKEEARELIGLPKAV